MLFCPYREKCSGCQYLDVPYSQQETIKKNHLTDLFKRDGIHTPPDLDFVSVGEYFLRDRLDFTLQDGRLGLFEKDSRKIVDIETCLQLSPSLQAWLGDFRQIVWPMEKASFRLRVSPRGLRGVWIDAANLDIKKLLEEQDILSKLLHDKVAVEIGQRRKRLSLREGVLKLEDPRSEVWFQTWMEGRPIPLYSQIASFTQPSLQANQKISQYIEDWVGSLPSPRVLEFGSGIGNLSFPALSHATSLTACEVDKLSLDAFSQSLEAAGVRERVKILAGDFQKKEHPDFSQYSVILCNPPRSGLMNFLDPLLRTSPENLPSFFIYMSCFPESLCEDLKKLQNYNYRLSEAKIIDQFPQTKHYEVLCLLQRK